MPNVSITAEGQTKDTRSSEYGCAVRIKNEGNAKVRLVSLRPLNPSGTIRQNVLDNDLTTQTASLTQHYTELSTIIMRFVTSESEEYREQLAAKAMEGMNEFFKETKGSGILGFVTTIFSKKYVNFFDDWYTSVEAWTLKVESADDALQLYNDFLKDTKEKDTYHRILCNVYCAKIKATQRLEGMVGAAVHQNYIQDIESGGEFSRMYVFSCERSILNPKTYTLTFDCAYQILDDTANPGTNTVRPLHYIATSATTIISPKPLVLNLIAIGSSLLGAALKAALDAGGKHISIIEACANAVTNGSALAAVITALFFFNVYDSTEIGKKINAGSGWRSALIIGGLSGLVNDRVVQALRGLFG
jgi:hypothetical protein